MDVYLSFSSLFSCAPALPLSDDNLVQYIPLGCINVVAVHVYLAFSYYSGSSFSLSRLDLPHTSHLYIRLQLFSTLQCGIYTPANDKIAI